MRALICLLSCTGQRKSEALLPDGEQWDLSRASRSQITWKIAQVYVADASEQQLRNLSVGDIMFWTLGRSKADYSGTAWGSKTVPMRWHGTAVLNAPRMMAQMELGFMVRGKAREATPLFTTKALASKPVRFADVELLLRPMLVASGGCNAEEAMMYSWHSFRIFLACALKAANVSDADIQVMLRWKSVASLHAYSKSGLSKNSNGPRSAS